MLIPSSIAIGSVFLGWALGVFGRRESASRRTATALSTFAMVAALAVVLAQLLPDALAEVGLPALLVFGASAALPSVFGKIAQRRGAESGGEKRTEAWTLELGYLGLLVHQAADGVGLGTYGGELHRGHDHFDVLIAIAAHTIPVVAVLTLSYARERGVRSASLRALGLAAASVFGVFSTTLVPTTFHTFEPWITAAVAGLLLHVVAHDFGKRRAPGDLKARRTVGERALDFLAIAAGILLVWLADGHDHGGGELRHAMATALFDLSLETAPALLIGLFVGALLITFGAHLPTGWRRSGGAFPQAARGAVIGAPLPIYACGVLPVAASLKKRGASAALVVAFVVSTPGLGIETLALSVRFIGWPFALVRLGAAIAIAIVAGWVVHRVSGGPPARDPQNDFHDVIAPDDDGSSASTDRSIGQRLLSSFDGLLYHVAPWMTAGLIVAAYVQVTLPNGDLEPLRAWGLDILIIALVAIASSVSAASATPLAAVLLLKGMGPGAVLIGLLLGPAIHLATVAFVGKSYGTRAVVFGVGALVLAATGFAIVLDQSPLPPVIPPLDATARHAPHALSSVAGALLLLALVRSIWQAGLRPWLASLGESLSLASEPGVAPCGHDHDHDHASHDHASHDHASHGGGSNGHGSHDHGSHDHGSHDHAPSEILEREHPQPDRAR